MSSRLSAYPETCGLCGAKRELVGGSQEIIRHRIGCNWRRDPRWQETPKPPQTGQLALDVRWSNGNSMVNATITQEQYGRILGIIHEKVEQP